jgi:hypothetical protein
LLNPEQLKDIKFSVVDLSSDESLLGVGILRVIVQKLCTFSLGEYHFNTIWLEITIYDLITE